MPRKKVAKKKVVKRKPAYDLEIEVNDVVFKASTSTLQKALEKFVESPEFPVGPKTITRVKFSKGKRSHLQVWHVPKARKILKLIKIKPWALEKLAQQLTAQLNG